MQRIALLSATLLAALVSLGCKPTAILKPVPFSPMLEIINRPLRICSSFTLSSNASVTATTDSTLKTCPDQDYILDAIKLTQHNEAIGDVVLIYTNDFILCPTSKAKSTYAKGCSTHGVAVVHYGFEWWKTTRHELTHISLEQRGILNGDGDHTLPIWQMIDMPETQVPPPLHHGR